MFIKMCGWVVSRSRAGAVALAALVVLTGSAAWGQLAVPTSHPGTTFTQPTSSILLTGSDVTTLQTWWNTPAAGFQTTIKTSVNSTANAALLGGNTAPSTTTSLTETENQARTVEARALRWLLTGGGNVASTDFTSVVNVLKIAKVTGGSSITAPLAGRGYAVAYDLINSGLDAYDASLSQAAGTTRALLLTRLTGSNVLTTYSNPFSNNNTAMISASARGLVYMLNGGSDTNLDGEMAASLGKMGNGMTSSYFTNDGWYADGLRYENYFTANFGSFMNGYKNAGGDATGLAQYQNAATQMAWFGLAVRMPNGTDPNMHNGDNMPLAIHEYSRLITDPGLKAAAVWNAVQVNGHDWTSWSNATNNNWTYTDFMVLTDYSQGAAAPTWSPTFLSTKFDGTRADSRTATLRNNWTTTSNYIGMTAGMDLGSSYSSNDTNAITAVCANGVQIIVEAGYNRLSGDSVIQNSPGLARLNTAVATIHNVLLAKNNGTGTWGVSSNGTGQSLAGTTVTMTNRMDSQERGSFKGVMDFATNWATYNATGASGGGVQTRRSIGMVNESGSDQGYMIVLDSFRRTDAVNHDFAVNWLGKATIANTTILTDTSTLKEIRWKATSYYNTTSGADGLAKNVGDAGYLALPNGVPYSSLPSGGGQLIAHIVSATAMDNETWTQNWENDNYGAYEQTQQMLTSTTAQTRGAFITLFEPGIAGAASKWVVTPLSGADYAAAKIVNSTDNWKDWHLSQTNGTNVGVTTVDADTSIDSGALRSNAQYAYLRRNNTTNALDSLMMSRGSMIYSNGSQLISSSNPLTVSILYNTGSSTLYKGAVSTDDNTANTTLSFYNTGMNISSATLAGSSMSFNNAAGVKTLTLAGTAGGDLVVNFTVVPSALSLSTASASFGRVMLGATPTLGSAPSLTNSGTATASFTAATNNNGVTTAATAGTLTDGASSSISDLQLVNNANGTGAIGLKSYTYTVTNTSNGSDTGPTKVLTLDATVLAQRSVTAAAVTPGKILTGVARTSDLSTDSTSGNDNRNTRVNVASTTGPNGDGVQVTGGTGTVFGGPGGIVTGGARTVVFTTSGSKSGSIGLGVTTAEAGGVGDTAPYSNASIAYTADVYQAASLTVTGGSAIHLGNAISSDGGQRAAARLKTMNYLSGDNVLSFLSLTAGGAGTGTVVGEAASLTASPTFSANVLNGSYSATYTLGFEHDDQSILGTAANDLSTYNVTVAATANTYQGNQSATLQAGTTLAGRFANSDAPLGTVATLLDGTLSAPRSVSTSWRAANPGEGPNGSNLSSDVLSLTGLAPTPGSEAFVLELDAAPLINPLSAAAGNIFLAWLNGSDQWVNAVTGNSGFTSIGSPVMASYASYFTGGTGSHGVKSNNAFVAGDWGVDLVGNTAWAVLNHNSDFSINDITPTPEPASVVLMLGGLAMLTRRGEAARRSDR